MARCFPSGHHRSESLRRSATTPISSRPTVERVRSAAPSRFFFTVPPAVFWLLEESEKSLEVFSNGIVAGPNPHRHVWPSLHKILRIWPAVNSGRWGFLSSPRMGILRRFIAASHLCVWHRGGPAAPKLAVARRRWERESGTRGIGAASCVSIKRSP